MLKDLLFFILLLFFSPNPASSSPSKLRLESGYTVSTAIDFNKLLLPSSSIHPFALLPLRRSDHRLLLLDSAGSAFYSLSISSSSSSSSKQEGEEEVTLFAGNGKGVAGFSDGDGTEALFDRPRSFAVDGKDNVYVADRSNRAIRKITSSGFTTTVAGGYSEKTGHIDGPGQNASFSNDFDLVYVPTLCALLISDRGNRLIRQMDLKPEDCVRKTKSGLGMAPIAVIAVLALLIGLVLGFIARPFLASYEIINIHILSKTWKHYQTNLGRVAVTTYFAIRSAVANSMLYKLLLSYINTSLCYLSVVIRNIRLEKRAQYENKMTPKRHRPRQPVSVLQSDVAVSNCGVKMTQVSSDQLEDLISFDVNSSCEPKLDVEDDREGSSCKLDDMINANLLDFGGKPRQHSGSLVQRRVRG